MRRSLEQIRPTVRTVEMQHGVGPPLIQCIGVLHELAVFSDRTAFDVRRLITRDLIHKGSKDGTRHEGIKASFMSVVFASLLSVSIEPLRMLHRNGVLHCLINVAERRVKQTIL